MPDYSAVEAVHSLQCDAEDVISAVGSRREQQCCTGHTGLNLPPGHIILGHRHNQSSLVTLASICHRLISSCRKTTTCQSTALLRCEGYDTNTKS